MSKEKFLESLRKKLSILESSEIEDIISEYEGYIEEKIKKGSTEEEAVKSMGDVDELAKELLSAYKIKTDGENHGSINSLIDSFMKIFDEIVANFSNKSFNDIIKFLLEIVCIFLVIAICHIPFVIIEGIGKGFLNVFSSPFYHIFAGIWSFILNVVYFIFAVLMFVKIFESRYLNKDSSKEGENIKSEDKIKNEETILKEENSKEKIVSKRKSKEFKEEPRSFGIVDTLVKVCLLFVKFILFFVLFGVACYIVGMSVVLGLAFYLLIRGVFYLGIYLMLFALFVLGILAFLFLFNFIFDRKNHAGVLLILTLISFITLGVGTGICALDFANTTVIYNEEKENSKQEEYKFTMTNQFVLLPFHSQDIKIDDSLGEEIKVVYRYDDRYLKIEANPMVEKNGNFDVLHLRYHVRGFQYSKSFFDELIENLKKKTFVATPFNSVDVEVYMSSKTKETLLENKEKYRNSSKYYDWDDDCYYFGNDYHYGEYCKSEHHYYDD